MTRKHKGLLVVAILVGAMAIRAPITGVGALVGQIQTDFNLSSAVAGLITTIPLFMFGLISPFVSRWAERLGTGRVIVGGLAIMVAGLAVRSFTGQAGFFIGTALLGAGICFLNVLLPSIIKFAFPLRVGLMTALYTTFIGILAGLSPGVGVPLSRLPGVGWRGALFVWVGLALVALVFWLPQWGLRAQSGVWPGGTGAKGKSLFRSPLAWSVAIFMGVQSLLFYSIIAWLPTMLTAKGLGADTAGYISTLYLWVGLPTGFAAPIVAAKMKDQRPLVALVGGVFVASFLLMMAAALPVVLVGVVLNGLACGSCLSLAMCLISLRSADPVQTARLSGMAQSLGYFIAMGAPALLGGIYDATASWTPALLFLIAMAVVFTLSGLRAGRNETI